MSIRKFFKTKSETLSADEQMFIEGTPYSRNATEQKYLLTQLIRGGGDLLIDRTTNPEIGSLSIYGVDSKDPKADLGRTLEASIFKSDYGYGQGFIEEHFSPYDSNSFFFLAVDCKKADNPEIVGLLRVIDCSRGDSETVSMFKEFYGEKTALPEELDVNKGEETIWDIFTVVVDPKHRNGVTSLWLYHALYRSSIDQGVDRWVSNITPGEIKNLRDRLGVPFKSISGTGQVCDVMPNGKKVKYGFYYLDVDEIEPSARQRINDLEESLSSKETSIVKKRMNALLLKVAKTALLGTSEE
jgi:hypothetical protein